MGKLIKALTIFIIALTAISCNSTTVGSKVSSIGSPYEVLVVIGQDKWDGQVGDTIRSIMSEPVYMINQYEPMFTLLRIQPNGFNTFHRKTRNVLNVVTGGDYPNPAMNAQYNVYASPQLIVTVSGPDDRSIAEYMSEYSDELQSIFQIAERDWSLALNKSYGEPKIEQEIFDNFGFRINLGKGYKIRNTAKDFMWISLEYPAASQGIVIYSYPYSDRDNFTLDSLLTRRNEFASLIPGENPGSYMITSEEFLPELNHIRVNGRYWAEMRGFWDVKGDFMGGPFLSYSTLDLNTRRVITLDFYVYSPGKPKRNYLKQLENLIYSVSFPNDETQQGEN